MVNHQINHQSMIPLVSNYQQVLQPLNIPERFPENYFALFCRMLWFEGVDNLCKQDFSGSSVKQLQVCAPRYEKQHLWSCFL